MDPSQQRWIGVAVAGLGALALAVALTTDWWVIEQSAGGASVEHGLAPFEQDDDGEPFQGTEGETILVGALAVIALLGALGTTVFLIGHAAQIPALLRVPLTASLVAGGAVVFLAVVAVAMAATTWPNEDENEKFWDEETYSGFGGFGGGGSVTVDYHPGVGWWLEIVGGVAALSGTIVGWVAPGSPRMVAPPPGTYAGRYGR